MDKIIACNNILKSKNRWVIAPHYKERLRYLDFVKGFAILIFLLSHSIAEENGLQAWITSFNMPVFFMVTGILNGRRFDDKTPDKSDILVLIKKRVFQLGIPYLIWSTVISLFYIALEYLSHSKVNASYYFIRILTFQGMESMWFIPVIFFAELLLVVSLMNKCTRYLISALAFIASNLYCIFIGDNLFDQQLYIMLIRVCVKILIAYVFVYLGYMIYKTEALECIPAWACIPMLIAGIVLSQFNGSIGIGAVIIGNPILFWVNAIITSLAVIVFFRFLENTRIGNHLGLFEYYGKYTIVVLCTNNILIEVIRLLDSKLTGNVLISLGLLGSFILAFILAVLEYPLIMLAKGKLGFLFGKKRKS